MSCRRRRSRKEDEKEEQPFFVNRYLSPPSSSPSPYQLGEKKDDTSTMIIEQKFYEFINHASYVDAWEERFEMQHQDVDFAMAVRLWEDLERSNQAKAVAQWRDSQHRISALSCFVAVNAPPALLNAILRADPEATTEQDTQHGRTPLHYGIIAEVPAPIIQALLSANPKAAKVKDKYGKIPLHYRMMFGDVALRDNKYDTYQNGPCKNNKKEIHQEDSNVGVRLDASVRAMVKVHPDLATAQ
mmetsp:Transcript_5370/g.8155  ORF Transcript_5370/g.8155 Transcript_5370/m.8155 type:complete len:243 (-) Transcript_5370:1003-1731(-)